MPDAADPPGLRRDAVVAWLSDNGLPLSEPIRFELFPGGRSNVTYLLHDAHDRRLVLRRPPLGNVLPSANDMAREHRVLTGLHHVGYSAPEPLVLCTDETVIGAPFLVMEFVDGRIVATEADAEALSAGERDAICAGIVDALAALHALDVEAAGLSGLGRPEGYLPRQLSRWASQWELTKTRDLASVNELRDRIEHALQRVPASPPWSLVHGDYRLDNVILGRSDTAVRAVLDWEMSTLGDPLSDLALALVYWTEAGDGRRHLVPVAQHVTDAEGFWSRERIISAYAAVSGADLGHLDACVALACYKLAVITESIRARTLSGKQLGTAARHAATMGEATAALAEMGLTVIRVGTVAGLAS